MKEMKINNDESKETCSDCPVCKQNLEDHNTKKLIRCAMIELSKNNIKKMMFGYQDLTPFQTSSPSKGDSNHE